MTASDHARRAEAILATLRSMENRANVEGMARYGIVSATAYGVPMPVLRKMAGAIGRDHALAGQLWASRVYDARILASLIEEPDRITSRQMESWVKAFDNWAICDGCCSNAFDKSLFAWEKTSAWATREEEFVRRAGFVLMAALAVHDKKSTDREFLHFFPLIVRASADERKYVRKGVNWALRQIGKRSPALNVRAIRTANRIRRMNSASARWIAADAHRELTSAAVQRRLGKRG